MLQELHQHWIRAIDDEIWSDIFKTVNEEIDKEIIADLRKAEEMYTYQEVGQFECLGNYHASMHEQVQQLAYYKWQAAGCPDHQSDRFWFEAEGEVMMRITDA